MKEMKHVWDSDNVFNPGKIVDSPAMNVNLRYEGARLGDFHTYYDFTKEQGVLCAAEQCNGAAECRKSSLIGGLMCPTFKVSGREEESTRARANIVREMLSFSEEKDPLGSREVKQVLDDCLMCKACKRECSSNVDIRFNNNRKYPVCRYGELTIKSPNGIHTVIEFSNHELAYDIQNKLVLFGNQFNKILESTKKDEALKDENEAKSFKVVEKKKIDNIDSIIYDTNFDPIYKDVLEFVISSGKVSASLLQRRFKLGYNRACRIIDHMEEQGIVGPQNGSKPRDVLVKVSEEGGE